MASRKDRDEGNAVVRTYAEADFPHGLICADCKRPFIEGQPISQVPDAIGGFVGDPVFYSILKCVECAMGGKL